MSSNIDYYAALGVSSTASTQQIRDAYKRAALKTHPDRVAHNDPTRPARTKKFQQVNDAYYILSDPVRRRDYDATRTYARSSSTRPPPPDSDWQDAQFGEAFEEMMNEAGLNEEEEPTAQGGTGSVWSLLGGISGATIGFIVANVPGMVAGAVAGNRLGAIRDRKGQSVYQVFQELPQDDKAKVLKFSFDIGVSGSTSGRQAMREE
ncbi:DnaJ domain-containing protein [Trichophaea hybrida]|nr:DnaJ domain-containing protein [Trichophaea hybrida]